MFLSLDMLINETKINLLDVIKESKKTLGRFERQTASDNVDVSPERSGHQSTEL